MKDDETTTTEEPTPDARCVRIKAFFIRNKTRLLGGAALALSAGVFYALNKNGEVLEAVVTSDSTDV